MCLAATSGAILHWAKPSPGTNFDPTNVSPMAVEGMDADAPCYDLSGHVLATPADGANGRRGVVVIQGGRKYLVR